MTCQVQTSAMALDLEDILDLDTLEAKIYLKLKQNKSINTVN